MNADGDTRKVEGAIVFDGLVEGRLPEDPAFADRLRQWVRLLAKLGLRMDLEIEGGSFSLLASAAPVPVARFGGDPEGVVGEALEQLAAAFPDLGEAQLFSTLRSIEYAPGEEKQVVYLLKPDGSVETPDRVLPADTEKPPAPLSSGDRVRVILVALAVVGLLFGITSIFVDYGELFQSVASSFASIDVEAVDVDASVFGPFFTIEEKRLAKGSRAIQLTLKRTPLFPRDDDAFDAAYADPDLPWKRRLALDAIARGYAVYEVLDDDGEVVGRGALRLAGLRDEETIDVDVPVKRDPRPKRIRIGF